MMEVKDVIEYLNNEGFSTKVNDYDVIFVDATKYDMDNHIMIDLTGKEIICGTPIHEEVDKRIIKPLMLMLGLDLIDYPSGRYSPISLKGIWNQTDAEKELLDLIFEETETDHERHA